jgi:ADP-ribose pyrophosphatase YjhB (NUDIX family)
VSGGRLTAMIAALEAELGDPRRGLPEEVFRFVSRLTPLANVDLLIQDEARGTLLTWREDEFFGTGWHRPGGIIRYKETAEQRVRACARDELAADVAFDETPLAIAEGISEQDTRGHHIALLFRCHLLGEPDPSRAVSSARPASGQWQWHRRCPDDLLEAQRPYARYFIEP